ncbi:hypothetical protein BC939DRAFT_443757, partial [Gamsiella multidivaricata]
MRATKNQIKEDMSSLDVYRRSTEYHPHPSRKTDPPLTRNANMPTCYTTSMPISNPYLRMTLPAHTQATLHMRTDQKQAAVPWTHAFCHRQDTSTSRL